MPLSTFIGREEEMSRLRGLVGERRLVTVVGPGGIGKTRIAVELGERTAPAWPGGVRRVELSAVGAQADLTAEVAAQLGCATLGEVVQRLGNEPTLVVLDNCEHVLEQAAAVCARLVESPRLHVLATSRAPLAIDGEHVLLLGPLGLPATGDAEEIAAAPTIRLYADRARAAGAAWDESAEHLRDVAELCRRLDGIPLAIELAAARARALGTSDLLAHLDRRFDLLRRSVPIGTARHASLRAAIDTSYALLSPDEQALLRALGVFAGSFDATVAQAVGLPDGDRVQTLELLSRLVDHSLVVAETGVTTRYRLLDSLRSYARERAAEHGESAMLRERFAAAMIEVADRITAAGLERWTSDVLGSVLAECANLIAAVDHCIQEDPTASRAFRLLLPLWGVIHQGRATDVAGACERALERWPRSDEPLHAEVLAIAANAHLSRGDMAAAADRAERCLRAPAVTAIAPVVALRTLAMAELRAGRSEEAVEHFERGREIAARAQLASFEREFAVFVAWIQARFLGSASALDALPAIAESAARAGDQIAEAWARIAHAQLLLLAGRLDEARAALEQSKALERKLDHPWGTEWVLRLDAVLETLAMDWASTRRTWRTVIDVTASRHLGELALALECAAVLAHRAGDAHAARALAAAIPLEEKGTVLGSPFESEFVALVESGALALPPPGSRWSQQALQPVRELLGRKPDELVAHDAPNGPPATHETTMASPAAELRRAGDTWSIRFAGREVQVRDRKGIEDLAWLLTHPDEDIHCLDLMGGGDVGSAAGPGLDEQSRREYRARVRELQVEIDEARSAADLHRAERAEAELDLLVEQLSQAFGLGGRARQSGAAAERARAAVTWRIRRAIRQIGEVHAELARHLPNSVRTGTWCSYRPDVPIQWVVEAPSRRKPRS